MQYFYYLIYIIAGILIPTNLHAAAEKENISDLMKQCEETRSLSKYEALETSSDKLITVAKNKKNLHAENYAYFYNGLAKLFRGKSEEAMNMLDIAARQAERNENDSIKALVFNARGIYHAIMQNNNFVAQQYFFKSIELAQKSNYEDLRYRVMGNLLTLSHTTGDSIVLKNAKQVYQYGMKNRNSEQISLGAYFLATYYYKQKDYSNCEKYIKIALDTYKKYPYEDISIVYSLYAKMLLAKGLADKAESNSLKAIDLARRFEQTSVEVEALITHAEVLNKQKRYTESNEMIKKAMNKAEEFGMTSKIADFNELMAKNFIATGNHTEAIKCLQIANMTLSNLVTINMERLSHEQEIMHNIEKQELDAKLRQEQIASQKKVMLTLTFAIIILLVLLIAIINSYRHRQILYKKIVLQNSRSVEYQKRLQERLDRLMREKEENEKQAKGKEIVTTETQADKADEPQEQPSLTEERLASLYADLCRLMDDERLFTEPQLTREKMAERLGTNRTYLTKVIKEKTNMTYLQFINSYRINEAIKILSNKELIDYPLKQIWSDLGFSSPSTFFKLFQQAVGITPSIYRKQFLEVNSEVEADKTYDEESA